MRDRYARARDCRRRCFGRAPSAAFEAVDVKRRIFMTVDSQRDPRHTNVTPGNEDLTLRDPGRLPARAGGER